MAESRSDLDAELWSRRLAALAPLGRADALAVILPVSVGRFVAYATHNLGPDSEWFTLPAQFLVGYTIQQQRAQRRTDISVPLRDGRRAISVVVEPVSWRERIVGTLLVLRVGGPPTAEEDSAATRMAELVAVELATSSLVPRAEPAREAIEAELRRAREDRRHAIALYELTRIDSDEPGERADRAVDVLADTLDCDLAAIWRRDAAGRLQLAGSRGYGALPPGEADERLEAESRERGVRRLAPDGEERAPWMGRAAALLIVPIGSEAGALVLGRNDGAFSEAEATLAPTLAECLEPVMAAIAEAAAAAPAQAARPSPARYGPLPTDLPVDLPAVVMADEPAAAPARPAPTEARQRRRWALPLFVLGALAAAAGIALGEPLALVVAGVVILLALWGWTA